MFFFNVCKIIISHLNHIHNTHKKNKNAGFLLSCLKDMIQTSHNHNYWPYGQTTVKQNVHCSHTIRLFNMH